MVTKENPGLSREHPYTLTTCNGSDSHCIIAKEEYKTEFRHRSMEWLCGAGTKISQPSPE
jgi:hypothetical protein